MLYSLLSVKGLGSRFNKEFKHLLTVLCPTITITLKQKCEYTIKMYGDIKSGAENIQDCQLIRNK